MRSPSASGQIRYASRCAVTSDTSPHDPSVTRTSSEETYRPYGVLDRRLADVEFVAGELSVADFAILGWAWRHERHQVALSQFPNVRRWYETLWARPGVQRGFTVKLDDTE
ncbi:glutathione binding-like protein [Cupriavidus sp. PET2-C1]